MYLAAEHHLLFTFAGGGLRTRAINTCRVREQRMNKGEKTQLCWKPCKPLTAVKVNAGTKSCQFRKP